MTVLSPLSDTKDCIFDHYVFASTTESNTGQVHSIRWICAVWTMRMKKKKFRKAKIGGRANRVGELACSEGAFLRSRQPGFLIPPCTVSFCKEKLRLCVDRVFRCHLFKKHKYFYVLGTGRGVGARVNKTDWVSALVRPGVREEERWSYVITLGSTTGSIWAAVSLFAKGKCFRVV